ncbi:MAG: response regulator [Candidatus Aminicenantes bacterium]|nr:MAG: response regulator [Candidatus Aminicenantes bacterium]
MARILIIEDDLQMLEIILYTLKREGYDVIGTLSGEEGMMLYRRMNFDLIITDLFLPDTLGLEIIVKLRKEGDLKIIAISDGMASFEMARRMGAHYSLTRPFSMNELSSAVKELLGD